MNEKQFKKMTKKHVEICHHIIKKGNCKGVNCRECPFDYTNATNGKKCSDNNYSCRTIMNAEDLNVLTSSKVFIQGYEIINKLDDIDKLVQNCIDELNVNYNLDDVGVCDHIEVLIQEIGSERIKCMSDTFLKDCIIEICSRVGNYIEFDELSDLHDLLEIYL